MKIAVIGAGNVGTAVARAGVNSGNDVVLTATTPERAQTVAASIGARAAANNPDAVRQADLVVLAVPYSAVADVADEIADAASGNIIIDATNALKPDLSGLAVTDRSAAELLQERLPSARVVKAFNTVFASRQAAPVVDGSPLDGFYAGNDTEAKQTVAEFLTAIGYRPIDAGGLPSARALEHMAYLNILLNAGNGWPWQSGWKLVGPTD